MKARLLITLPAALLAACGSSSSPPESRVETEQANSAVAETAEASNKVSPVRGIRRDRRPPTEQQPAAEFRRLDGSGNNVDDPQMGAAGIMLTRMMAAKYADGASSMAGGNRPNPRLISNQIMDQDAPRPNTAGLSDFLWQWGQFLDHDIDLTDGMDPPEPMDIAIPIGDAWFDPDATGTQVMSFNRSLYNPDTGLDASSPRQQMNEITAWIDASQVYGVDPVRARALRRLDGSGELRLDERGFLPRNVDGLANAGGPSPELFLAGDVRANEQTGLTVMHTLFVREHNRLVAELRRDHPNWSGEQLYQQARALVGAEMQQITYREFLPALLGPNALPPYSGYKPNIDARITNEFSTAAYRLGHSMLSTHIQRLNAAGEEIAAGHLDLRDAFFNPARITDEGGLAPVLRGLAAQRSQSIDHFIVDDVRNFLFGPPGAGGFDLAALNIQRGRDHGLPDYNSARVAMGLPRANRFADISRDPDTRQRLANTYASVDEIDLWVGGLAEDKVRNAQVGPLFRAILIDQFLRLRDGDRFWYERALPPPELDRIRGLRLSDIIRRNTRVGDELADDVFRTPS